MFSRRAPQEKSTCSTRPLNNWSVPAWWVSEPMFCLQTAGVFTIPNALGVQTAVAVGPLLIFGAGNTFPFCFVTLGCRQLRRVRNHDLRRAHRPFNNNNAAHSLGNLSWRCCGQQSRCVCQPRCLGCQCILLQRNQWPLVQQLLCALAGISSHLDLSVFILLLLFS